VCRPSYGVARTVVETLVGVAAGDISLASLVAWVDRRLGPPRKEAYIGRTGAEAG